MINILKNVYGKSFLHFPDWPTYEQATSHLQKFIKKRGHPPLAIGGHMEYGIHDALEIDNPYYFAIAREPVSRCISHFLFKLERHNTIKSGHVASLPPFPVKFYCTSGSNMQTRIMSGRINNYDFNNSNYELIDIAIQRIQDNSINCITIDQTADLLQSLATSFSWEKFPEMPVIRKTSLPKPFLSSEEIEQLRKNNILDIKLYEFIRAMRFNTSNLLRT